MASDNIEKASVHLIKLFKEGGTNYYQACSTVFTGDDQSSLRRVDLLAVDVDECVAFKTSVDVATLASIRDVVRSDDVENWAKLSFSTSCPDFSFSFDADKKTLNWKKGGAKVRIKLGSIPCTLVDWAEAQNEIFGQIVSLTSKQAEELKSERARNCDLMDALKQTRHKLEQLTEEKGKLEQTLYGKFIPILQSKQDKIRHLMKEIEVLQQRSNDLGGRRDADVDVDDDGEAEMMDSAVAHAVSSSEGEEEEEGDADFRNRSIDSQNFLNLI